VAQKKIDDARYEIDRAKSEIMRLQAIIADQSLFIDNERENITRLQENCVEGDKWIAANPRPSIIELTEKIKSATEHNKNNTRIGELGLQQQEMIKLKTEVEGYKGTIEATEKKRNDLIANSQLPVEGLSFDDEEVYYKGVPLEEGQLNTALLFDIGVEVAMALNPNLKIIFLDDASLFDREHLKSIIDKIESRGYMVVAEVVAESDDVEVHFTEEELI